jgi:hypothetical protein
MDPYSTRLCTLGANTNILFLLYILAIPNCWCWPFGTPLSANSPLSTLWTPLSANSLLSTLWTPIVQDYVPSTLTPTFCFSLYTFYSKLLVSAFWYPRGSKGAYRSRLDIEVTIRQRQPEKIAKLSCPHMGITHTY